MNNQDSFPEQITNNTSAATSGVDVAIARATDGGNLSQNAEKKGPIQTKIEALSEKIKSEGANGNTGKELRDKATALILKNAGSEEWSAYMKLFNFSESELQALMPDTNDQKNLALAYLVGNGPCGGASTDAPTHNLIFGVTDALDKP